MLETLTLEDKINIIYSHIKNIDILIFNANLTIIEESALNNVERISEINQEIEELGMKKDALLEELNKFV